MGMLDKKNQIRDRAIRNVMAKTGWTYDEAAANVKAAQKRCGILYSEYNKYNFFKIPDDEQDMKYREILRKRIWQQLEYESCVENIMENTGWTQEETEKKLQDAKDRLGIECTDYTKYHFYHFAETDQPKLYETVVCQKAEYAKQVRERKEECINATMNERACSREEAEEIFKQIRARTGCRYTEYLWYKLYRMSEEEQNEVCLKTVTKKVSAKYNLNNQFARLLDDKAKTNAYFAAFMKRPWCVNTKVTVDAFKDTFRHSNRIMYKPVEGLGGRGIRAFDITPDNIEDVYHTLSDLPEGVVEEYVVQHPAMSALAPASVNTIRIVTVSSKTTPVVAGGKYMDVAYAALRIGGGTAVVDNFHSGGMVAVVDIATGKVVTDATDKDGNVFAVHPVTGKAIRGFQIPLFDQAIQLVKDACEMDVVEGSLGWDIAVTADGPVLIEANIGPGVELVQQPYLTEGKGIRYLMERYFDRDAVVEASPEDMARRIANEGKYVRSVMAKTGWTRKKATELMERAKRTYRISYGEYDKLDFHALSDEQRKKTAAELKTEKDAKRLEELLECEEICREIMKKTGWDYDLVQRNVLKAQRRTGCTYKEYLMYRFYELTSDQQDQVLVAYFSRRITAKYDVNPEFAAMLYNKEATNLYFAEYVKRPWCVNTKTSYEEFKKTFAGTGRVIYKPLDGNRGRGVEAYKMNRLSMKRVYNKLSTCSDGVVEGYVVQHPTLSKLAPSSVNTIRIVTISSNTQPVLPDGRKFDVAYAALRIGSGKSVVDNFHSGGMVAAVDLENGALITDAVDSNGNVYAQHPVTGMKIKGFQIPMFKEAVAMVKEACSRKRIEGYLGWDIAITRDGPVLIELNVIPGVDLLSAPYAIEGKGMKWLMERYL